MVIRSMMTGIPPPRDLDGREIVDTRANNEELLGFAFSLGMMMRCVVLSSSILLRRAVKVRALNLTGSDDDSLLGKGIWYVR